VNNGLKARRFGMATPGLPLRARSCIAMAFGTVPATSDRDTALMGRNLHYDTPGKICSSIDFL
jgi:hypothetical protein